MTEKYGVENIKKLTIACADAATLLDDVVANGANYVKDLAELPKLYQATQEFSAVSWAGVLPEASDFSDAERQEVGAFFQSKLKLRSQSLDDIVNEGMAILLGVIEGVRVIREFVGKVIPATPTPVVAKTEEAAAS